MSTSLGARVDKPTAAVKQRPFGPADHLHRLGDTLRVRVVITEKRETKKPDRGIVTYRHEVVNQRGELVLEAVIKRMIRRAAATS